MQDLMRRLIELKAQQDSQLGEQDMPDNVGESDEDRLQMMNSFPEQENESEQETEDTITDPQAPQEAKISAIKKVRQKYLGA